MLWMPDKRLFMPFGAARGAVIAGGGFTPTPIAFVGAKTAYVSGAANTAHTGTSFSVAASGPNRKLILFGVIETATATSITFEYNSITATSAVNATQVSTPDVLVQLAFIDDADLPTDGASHAFEATVDPSANLIMGAVEYKGMAQGAPSATDTDVGNNPSTITASVPADGSGGILISCIGSDAATGDWTPTAPAVERSTADGTPDGSIIALADKIGVSGAQSIEQTGSTVGARRAHAGAAWGEATS